VQKICQSLFYLKTHVKKTIELIINLKLFVFLFFITFFSVSKANILLKKNCYKKKDNNCIKYQYTIFKGDQIGTILNQSGVNINDILKLIKKDSCLNVINIGDTFSWTINKSGELLELKWYFSKIQKKIYKRVSNNFIVINHFPKILLKNKIILIKKNSNFFKSAQKSGLNKNEIYEIIKAIKWQINFNKLNIGSNFNLIFLYKSDSLEKTKKNRYLLGIKLNNFGKTYYSIRAFNESFYNINGLNEKNDFMDFSFLKKYRISSKFNLNRLHPITHRVSRHLGIDLAMPEGTPVLATSNGQVKKAEFNSIAGFFIEIEHLNQFKTRYMHLKKILIHPGDEIKKGEKIALSGNTGRTTGPHLHYEIWNNNCAINPMNVQYLFFKILTNEEKKIFLKESKKILKMLK